MSRLVDRISTLRMTVWWLPVLLVAGTLIAGLAASPCLTLGGLLGVALSGVGVYAVGRWIDEVETTNAAEGMEMALGSEHAGAGDAECPDRRLPVSILRQLGDEGTRVVGD